MERRLIQAAQQGDKRAFTTLYRQNVQQIFRYVYYRTNDQQIAEDITSEVFVRALRGLPKYKDRGKPFIAWLYRIAHARVVDYYRRTGRLIVEDEMTDDIARINPDMDNSLLQERASELLKQAILTLTEEQQQVIILRFIEGQSINVVAEAMNKKPNAIKALQHRAIRSLASHFERSGLKIEDILT